MGNKKEEVSLAGREKHWLRDYSSIGLPGGVCSPYPVNSLNCTLQRPFRPGSARAPPGYSMERIYHREESILKFSFLLLPFSTLPPLCLSLLSLSSLPFSFLSLFIFLFFVFSSERNYTGQTSPKLAIFLFVLPQSILITSVRYHNTILFPTLNTKLKLSSLLLQKTSKEHTCQHRLDSGSFQGYWLSSLCFDFRAQRHSNL